jgi:hypothetical protein
MPRFSASVATTGFALLFAAVVSAQTQTQPQPTVSVSKVRIVRLSEVRGAVQLDRSMGHGFGAAIANLPVVEQNSLKTDEGVAEVEFEDNSTLRLGPNSEVQFVELGRTAAGSTLSTVRVVKGIVYVSLMKAPGKAPANEFKLALGDRTIPLQPDTHVRLVVDDLHAKLAVLNGTVHLDGPDGTVDVSHKKTATFALVDNAQPTVAGGVQDGSLDTWDKQQDQFHSRVALASFGATPYTYGLSDMGYYGTFADMGCGMMWRPYFTSAAWDPYGSGAWAYYSGAGYSWVSPYPWGWTPYHYGSWSFCPGAGWGWMPGGSWMGLNNVAGFNGSGANPINGKGGPRLPVAPPAPPRTGEPSLITLNQTATPHSAISSSGSFVFRKDSAGLGIPRGELGNLKGFSERADRSGEARTPVYFSAGSGNAPGALSGLSGRSNTLAPVAIHRGSPPQSIGFEGGFSPGGMGTTRTTSTSFPAATSGPAPAAGGVHR